MTLHEVVFANQGAGRVCVGGFHRRRIPLNPLLQADDEKSHQQRLGVRACSLPLPRHQISRFSSSHGEKAPSSKGRGRTCPPRLVAFARPPLSTAAGRTVCRTLNNGETDNNIDPASMMRHWPDLYFATCLPIALIAQRSDLGRHRDLCEPFHKALNEPARPQAAAQASRQVITGTGNNQRSLAEGLQCDLHDLFGRHPRYQQFWSNRSRANPCRACR